MKGGWMKGRKDGRKGVWMAGRVEGGRRGRIEMDGWMDGWMDGRK